MADRLEKVRKLAALAADERTPMPERVAAALECCRRMTRDGILGEEVHPNVSYRVQRVDGPLYLIAEEDRRYRFVMWRDSFRTEGIPMGAIRELVVPRAAVISVEWLDDDEKSAMMGCCPSNPVASYVELAVSR